MFTCNIENPSSPDIIGFNRYSTVTITGRALPTASDSPLATQSHTQVRTESSTIPIKPATPSQSTQVKPATPSQSVPIKPATPTQSPQVKPNTPTESKPIIIPATPTASKPVGPVSQTVSKPVKPVTPTQSKHDEPDQPTQSNQVGPIPPKTNEPGKSSANGEEGQIGGGSNATTSNKGLIAGVVIGVLIVIVIVVILIMFYIKGKGNKEETNTEDVLTDSEMETADYFSTNEAFGDEDDPLWGSTEESPVYGITNDDMNSEQDDLDFEEVNYFTSLT